MTFSDKKVLVTGASRGIGRAIAKAYKDKGAWVVGTRTGRKNKTDSLCNEWIEVDFSSIEQIKDCADYSRKFEPDILVNNAGINKIAPFVEITQEEFLLIHQVNVLAPFLLCQSVIPAMKNKAWGRIVNISSIWGKIGKELRASYSASKFAIDGMTLALAAEHSKDGIITNSIAPGLIDTELTRNVLGEAGMKTMSSLVPSKRLGKVEEIARLVLWLTSEENTYLTGQNIAIDGGLSRV